MAFFERKGAMFLDCKPCRVVHCYKIEDKKAHIVGFDGVIVLNSTATIIWNMANGKNTLEEILIYMKTIYEDVDEKTLLRDNRSIIDKLYMEKYLSDVKIK